MATAYKVHGIDGTAYTIPYDNVSQVIEANPYDKMRGVRQYIQLLNGTLVGTTSLSIVENNKTMLQNEVGVASWPEAPDIDET
jgi:translation elongation factor EF-4